MNESSVLSDVVKQEMCFRSKLLFKQTSRWSTYEMGRPLIERWTICTDFPD